jgi:hypothetical protein
MNSLLGKIVVVDAFRKGDRNFIKSKFLLGKIVEVNACKKEI